MYSSLLYLSVPDLVTVSWLEILQTSIYILLVSMPKKYELLNFRATEPNWPLIQLSVCILLGIEGTIRNLILVGLILSKTCFVPYPSPSTNKYHFFRTEMITFYESEVCWRFSVITVIFYKILRYLLNISLCLKIGWKIN